jgi:hypothetical protein
VLFQIGIKREKGYIYWITRDGAVKRCRTVSKKRPRTKVEDIVKTGITFEPGWLYYLNEDGDVARTEMLGVARKCI